MDSRVKQAADEGKDIYSYLGSIFFNVPYEECLEVKEDGSKNLDGYKWRKVMKQLICATYLGDIDCLMNAERLHRGEIH